MPLLYKSLHHKMAAENGAPATNVSDKEESSLTLLHEIETTFGEEIKTAFESKCSTQRALGHMTYVYEAFST